MTEEVAEHGRGDLSGVFAELLQVGAISPDQVDIRTLAGVVLIQCEGDVDGVDMVLSVSARLR